MKPLATVAIAILSIKASHAVIVAGTLGTGFNNAGQASLDAYLATTAYSPFPYFSNLIRVADSSGVYLGWNAGTDRGWVLTANHVTATSTIGVGGLSYSVFSSSQIAGSDLKLYQVSRGANPVPPMPSVSLASSAAMVGEFSLMTGRAYTNDAMADYDWVAPGTSDAIPMRWGTNTVEMSVLINLATLPALNVHRYLITDFDGAGDAGATAYDAQGALGDSGGGLFIHRGGQWVLAGTAHFVDDGPDLLEGTPTGDGITNPSQPGDFTGYTDIFQHRGAILGLTGTLVPEPSVALMSLGALGLVWRRRREATS